MPVESHRPPRSRFELSLAWAALAAAGSAVLAWAACCVLPIALSIAGLGLAGTSWFAEQRTLLLLLTLPVLAGGWFLVWRRRRVCALDPACRPPSRLTIVLLAMATLLTVAAMVWQPLIEPRLLAILRAMR
jgi:mercuric ion transport protein